MIRRPNAAEMSAGFRQQHAKPWSPRLLVCLIVLAAGSLALRLCRLDAESLYMDEIVTVESFHRDPWGVVVAAAAHGQPPLDNFIGAALARIGLADSDWWVRFPAVVFGAGGVLLLGLLVASFAGTGAGLTAALLLAVCPIHVYMSQEVRPYALMFFLALAGVLAFQRARKRNSRTSWSLFAAIVFLMLMTRWTDPFFVVFGLALYALGMRCRAVRLGDQSLALDEASRFRRTAVALFAAFFLYSPFFFVVLQHCSRAIGSTSEGWFRRVCDQLHQGFAALFAGYSTRTVFNALPGATWLITLGGVCTFAGALLLLARARRRGDGSGLFLAVFLPFPFVYAMVYARLGNAVPKPQYLLLSAAVVFACVAVVLNEIHKKAASRSAPVGALVFAAAISVFVLPMTRTTMDSLKRIDKRDWRGVMSYLKTHARPVDVAAAAASDTIPPTFAPIAYGKARYGPEHLKFVPISLAVTAESFLAAGWQDLENAVWLLVYTDRMYLGYDQVPPPSSVPANMAVHPFNGLFLLEVRGELPAIARLMEGIEALYKDLPRGRSLIAPALLRMRWSSAHGDAHAAQAALDYALGQCRSSAEAELLKSSFLAARFEPKEVSGWNGAAVDFGIPPGIPSR